MVPAAEARREQVDVYPERNALLVQRQVEVAAVDEDFDLGRPSGGGIGSHGRRQSNEGLHHFWHNPPELRTDTARRQAATVVCPV